MGTSRLRASRLALRESRKKVARTRANESRWIESPLVVDSPFSSLALSHFTWTPGWRPAVDREPACTYLLPEDHTPAHRSKPSPLFQERRVKESEKSETRLDTHGPHLPPSSSEPNNGPCKLLRRKRGPIKIEEPHSLHSRPGVVLLSPYITSQPCHHSLDFSSLDTLRVLSDHVCSLTPFTFPSTKPPSPCSHLPLHQLIVPLRAFYSLSVLCPLHLLQPHLHLTFVVCCCRSTVPSKMTAILLDPAQATPQDMVQVPAHSRPQVYTRYKLPPQGECFNEVDVKFEITEQPAIKSMHSWSLFKAEQKGDNRAFPNDFFSYCYRSRARIGRCSTQYKLIYR